MTDENENIDALIAGCKADDRKAQEKLYRNYYRAMMSLCLRYTKNEEDALEVLNTGFLKIFRNIHSYDATKAGLFTWMRTIIVNSCLDLIKSQQKYPKAGELDHAAEVEIEPEVVIKIKSAELLRMIRELPPATQAVFNLYVIEGYHHKEIGKLMKISEGTSKWHLSEARKILQQKIREQQLINE